MENTKKTDKTSQKTDKNDLSIIQKAALFFMNLTKSPATTGERRLIKNVSTGKWEWTEGKVPFETTLESLHPDNVEPGLVKESVDEEARRFKRLGNLSHEPYRGNRWKFEFPGIPEYAVQNLTAISDTQTLLEIVMLVGQGLEDTLEYYNAASKNAQKKKLKKSATLEMLDPTGVPLSSYVYKNLEISKVDFFDKLSYEEESVLTARILFKHTKRTKI